MIMNQWKSMGNCIGKTKPKPCAKDYNEKRFTAIKQNANSNYNMSSMTNLSQQSSFTSIPKQTPNVYRRPPPPSPARRIERNLKSITGFAPISRQASVLKVSSRLGEVSSLSSIQAYQQPASSQLSTVNLKSNIKSTSRVDLPRTNTVYKRLSLLRLFPKSTLRKSMTNLNSKLPSTHFERIKSKSNLRINRNRPNSQLDFVSNSRIAKMLRAKAEKWNLILENFASDEKLEHFGIIPERMAKPDIKLCFNDDEQQYQVSSYLQRQERPDYYSSISYQPLKHVNNIKTESD